jgi:hypothetical protein
MSGPYNTKVAARRAWSDSAPGRNDRASYVRRGGKWWIETKRNSGGRKMTKAQKRVNASKRSKKRRVATALRKFLHTVNPAIIKRSMGARVRKNPGGTITIIPVKIAKRGRR